jgi:hypothetical protein
MEMLSKEGFRDLTPEEQILYLNKVRHDLKITSTMSGKKIDYLDDLGFSDVKTNWKLKPKGGFEPTTPEAKAYADAVKKRLREQFEIPEGSDIDAIGLADEQYGLHRTGDPEAPKPTYNDFAESNPESYMNAAISTQPYDKLVETLNRLSDPMYTRYAGHLQGLNKTEFPDAGEVKGVEDWNKVKEDYSAGEVGLLEGAKSLGNEFPWGATMSAGEGYNNLSIQDKIKKKVEEKVAIKEAAPVVDDLLDPILDETLRSQELPIGNPVYTSGDQGRDPKIEIPEGGFPPTDVEVAGEGDQTLRGIMDKNNSWDKNNGLKDLEFKAGVFL